EPRSMADMIDQAERQAMFSRKEVFPFKEGAWFPDVAGSTFLKNSKVTIVYKIDRERGSGLSLSEGRVGPIIAQLRRLKQTYGDRVEVVLHVPTMGFLWSSPPLSFEHEARALRWLFFEHLKLPFTVFVDRTPIAKRNDGKLLRGQSPNNVVA